jgi:hypothetical protein
MHATLHLRKRPQYAVLGRHFAGIPQGQTTVFVAVA